MEISKEIQENKITIRGKHYYMINDFAAALDKSPNSIYQWIYRKEIPDNHILKLHKTIFISENELKERLSGSPRPRIMQHKMENTIHKSISVKMSDEFNLTPTEIKKLKKLLKEK